jgi:hypothetical protein
MNKIIFKQACEILDVPIPKIHWELFYNNCSFGRFLHPDGEIETCLNFGIFFMLNLILNNKDYIWVHFKIDGLLNRIRFIIYHELGHYCHFMKHPRHFELCRNESHFMVKLNDINYRELKREKIADKIGLYLLKKII